jgi:hypothetical protein
LCNIAGKLRIIACTIHKNIGDMIPKVGILGIIGRAGVECVATQVEMSIFEKSLSEKERE